MWSTLRVGVCVGVGGPGQRWRDFTCHFCATLFSFDTKQPNAECHWHMKGHTSAFPLQTPANVWRLPVCAFLRVLFVFSQWCVQFDLFISRLNPMGATAECVPVMVSFCWWTGSCLKSELIKRSLTCGQGSSCSKGFFQHWRKFHAVWSLVPETKTCSHPLEPLKLTLFVHIHHFVSPQRHPALSFLF